ncbi:hypothetical protein B9Z55_022272 [Caenorhabditis nigoni]|uniref:Uncharacterized protein n=1 Tax=Caenorhabditis nigoni TaxID=1611254 RepID=A0A2G5SK17_9PELO|nr:hypothetical protein B9Z55_022272 [Caenorhabditis nigoni]
MRLFQPKGSERKDDVCFSNRLPLPRKGRREKKTSEPARQQRSDTKTSVSTISAIFHHASLLVIERLGPEMKREHEEEGSKKKQEATQKKME